MLFYFLLSQDSEIEFDAKEATFLLTFDDEIVMTVFIWYKNENWKTAFTP